MKAYISMATHVSRATLNQPSTWKSLEKRDARTRKRKRKMRLRKRRGYVR